MKLHAIQHVPFETPARIFDWAQARGAACTTSHPYAGDAFPKPDAYDFLVVMGGPMGVCDTDRFPWLPAEIDTIAHAIDAGKAVLGVCLGAQLIAAALGARVTPGPQKEIGWFDVHKAPGAEACPLAHAIPETMAAFHWHGDRFEIPPRATHLLTSAACDHQAFAIDSQVLALQFHLEVDAPAIDRLIDHCADELTDTPFVQAPEALRNPTHLPAAHHHLNNLLDALCAGIA